jgi:hypothetical protein
MVTARLLHVSLNVIARSYMYNLFVLFLVVLIFILDIVLAGFLEISYQIPCKIYEVTEVYKGEYLAISKYMNLSI